MAMSGNSMGQEVAMAIMNMSAPPEVQAAVIEFWQKVCTAITNHIVQNAEVPAGIDVETTGTAAKQNGKTTVAGQVK